MEKIITELTECPSFKGLFRIYIERGLQEKPEELIGELYNQIQCNPILSKELMGEQLVNLIERHIENADANTVTAFG